VNLKKNFKYRNRMKSFFENFHQPFVAPVLPIRDVVVNGKRNAFYRVFQIRLTYCRIV